MASKDLAVMMNEKKKVKKAHAGMMDMMYADTKKAPKTVTTNPKKKMAGKKKTMMHKGKKAGY